MKILHIIGLTLLLQITILNVSAQNNIVLEGVDIIAKQFEQKEDTLYIKLHIDMENVNIKSEQAVSYSPIISTSTKNVNLPEVTLRGRSSYKEYLREIALMTKKERADYNSQSHSTIKAFGNNEKYLNYEYATPYEYWMADSKLLINSEISNCKNKSDIKSNILANITLEVAPIVSIVEEVPEVVIVIPNVENTLIEERFAGHISEHEGDVETIDVQKDEDILKIYFPVNVTTIDESYMGNSEELKRLKSVISEIQSSDNYNIAKVFIVGFASIEGSSRVNNALSLKRTNSIYNYLLNNTKVEESLIEVYNGAENWNGLRQMVVESDIIDKMEVLDIIDNISISEGRETALMNFNDGEAYKYMKRYLFPKLRYVYIKVYFDKNKQQ